MQRFRVLGFPGFTDLCGLWVYSALFAGLVCCTFLWVVGVVCLMIAPFWFWYAIDCDLVLLVGRLDGMWFDWLMVFLDSGVVVDSGGLDLTGCCGLRVMRISVRDEIGLWLVCWFWLWLDVYLPVLVVLAGCCFVWGWFRFGLLVLWICYVANVLTLGWFGLCNGHLLVVYVWLWVWVFVGFGG